MDYEKVYVKWRHILIIVCCIALFVTSLIQNYQEKNQQGEVMMTGNTIHAQKLISEVYWNKDRYYGNQERYERPSKLPAMKLNYHFNLPKASERVPPYRAEGFPEYYEVPDDIIHAYFAIFKDALQGTNKEGSMEDRPYKEGPYQYGYELFSDSAKKRMSLKVFEDSFKDINGMTLLQLEPIYQADSKDGIKEHFFVELEILKSYPCTEEYSKTVQPNFFEYYYGIITVVKENQGFRIEDIDYLPEVYIGNDLYGWNHDYKVFIEVIYNNWYKLGLVIDHTEIKNNCIMVYMSGADGVYRFDFIRLSNGVDVLLNEYIMEDGEYRTGAILKKDDIRQYKMSIDYINERKEGE